MTLRAIAFACCALLAGCGSEAATRGTLGHLPVRYGPLGFAPSASLVVPAPVDGRPSEEHRGASIQTSLFFTTVVVTHWQRRGNYVTDDLAASVRAVPELHAAMLDALRAAHVARTVSPDGPAEFELRTRIEHLYATHHAVHEGTVVVFAVTDNHGSGASNTDVAATARHYACYGNVILDAELIDRRDGSRRVVWHEHVVGSGQEPPGEDRIVAAQTALREAVVDALATLSVRVGAALDRLQRGPSGPGHAIISGFPPVFVVERVSRYRSFLERVYVDTASGRVLRHEVGPNADPALARPGDWLLSRRSPEGVMLSPEAYEHYARALAVRYDLRTVDDAYRYHFFGVRPGVVATPPVSPP